MSTKLSILILNYNTKNLTISCLDSIISLYKEKIKTGEFEILIGDNASTDGLVEVLSSKHKVLNIKLIQNKKNLGFAKGQNVLAKKAKGKYLFFLNSDTQIKNPDLFEMTHFLEKNSNVGILGAKMINKNGSSQNSAGKFYSLFNIFLTLFLKEGFGKLRFSPNKICEVDWVSGGAMMVDAKLFKKLNGFNEFFFMYIEDMEFCYKAKKTGFLTYFFPQQLIVHNQLGSSNRSYAILNIYRGILSFYKEHKAYWQFFLVKLLLIFKAIAAVLIGIITNNAYLKTTYSKALKI